MPTHHISQQFQSAQTKNAQRSNAHDQLHDARWGSEQRSAAKWRLPARWRDVASSSRCCMASPRRSHWWLCCGRDRRSCGAWRLVSGWNKYFSLREYLAVINKLSFFVAAEFRGKSTGHWQWLCCSNMPCSKIVFFAIVNWTIKEIMILKSREANVLMMYLRFGSIVSSSTHSHGSPLPEIAKTPLCDVVSQANVHENCYTLDWPFESSPSINELRCHVEIVTSLFDLSVRWQVETAKRPIEEAIDGRLHLRENHPSVVRIGESWHLLGFAADVVAQNGAKGPRLSGISQSDCALDRCAVNRKKWTSEHKRQAKSARRTVCWVIAWQTTASRTACTSFQYSTLKMKRRIGWKRFWVFNLPLLMGSAALAQRVSGAALEQI